MAASRRRSRRWWRAPAPTCWSRARPCSRAAATIAPISPPSAMPRRSRAGRRLKVGVLIEGAWRDGELPQETGTGGEFRRADSRFRDRITADGSSGFKAEAGRYHLYVAHGCPWAHRTLIYRSIKKLEGAITVAYAIPGLKQQGWMFDDDPAFPDCTPDSVNGFRYLHQAYTASDPRYTGKVTVPVLWDKKTKRIVNNESSEIIRMLNSEFRGVAGAERRDRQAQRLHLPEHQQRRLPLRLRAHAGSLRGGLRCAVRRARRDRG